MKNKQEQIEDLLKYLNYQFPATVGHIPLREKLTELSQTKDWIDVEEQLPEEGKEVLVSGGVACLREGIWYTSMEEPLFQRPIQWKVTHWMPIPFIKNRHKANQLVMKGGPSYQELKEIVKNMAEAIENSMCECYDEYNFKRDEPCLRCKVLNDYRNIQI